MFILFLLFLLPLQVEAETIYTPYQEQKNAPISFNLELEKKEEKEVYILQKIPKKTKHYYPATKEIKGYQKDETDFITLAYSGYKKTCSKENEVTWIQKITYNKLQAIKEITLTSKERIELKEISVYQKKKKLACHVTSSKMDTLSSFTIVLPKKVNPEEIELELTVFLRQDIPKATLVLTDDLQITNFQTTITKKGFSKVVIQLTNEMKQYKMSPIKEVFYQEEGKSLPYFYIHVLKQERYCKERKRKYRFVEDPVFKESDTAIEEGYTLLQKETKPVFYRREKIVLKDTLKTTTPYLLVDNFVESTSFPLKELILMHPPIEEEGIYPIVFSYQGFQIKRFFLYQKNVE